MTRIDELIQSALDELSGEVLHALAARKSGLELAASQEKAEPPTPVDWDACFKVDVNLTVRRLVELWRNLGLDDDIIGGHLLPRIIGAGICEMDALEALQRACGWRPRSDEERLEAVVRGMMGDGWTSEEVKAALRAAGV